MMCIYNTSNSTHYNEEENVRSDNSQIITSVGLPQTPPDSDPGSSPSGLSNEDSDSKESLVDTLSGQQDDENKKIDTFAKEMQDEDSSLCNDNASLSILRPSISKELLVENELIKQQDEETNNVQLPLFKDVHTNVSTSHKISPSDKQNFSALNDSQVTQKSKVVSVELPPTPPTMVDEIHNQKKRRRNSKLSKRKLRLSSNAQEEIADTPLKNLDKDGKSVNHSQGIQDDMNMEEVATSEESSEEEEQEIEKVLDVNPINRYKRVLVKNGEGGWLLQFVSPCGQYRFNSEKELALNLGQNIDQEEDEPHLKPKKSPKSPNDPFAQKLTILRKRLANGLTHYLRQSLDECAIRAQRNQIQSSHQAQTNESIHSDHEEAGVLRGNSVTEESRENKETKIAPFTFVNMRQNIFDMTASKRKRIQASCGKQSKYRKCHSTKDLNRRNSIAAIHVSTNEMNLGNDDPAEVLVSSDISHKNDEEQEIDKSVDRETFQSAQTATTESQNYQLCESIVTSIIYSCVDQQFSVENRLHYSSQFLETNIANENNNPISRGISTNILTENSIISNKSNSSCLQQVDTTDICNRYFH